MSENLENKDVELQKIQELMEKVDQMVDPEKYSELEQKYNTLLNDWINKRPAPKVEPKQVRPVAEIAKELSEISDGDVTNRDFWKLSLEYRNSFIQQMGKDPWTDGVDVETPQTKHIASTIDGLLKDFESPVAFRTQFNELLKDDPQVLRALKAKEKNK